MLYRNTYLEIDLDIFHKNVKEILLSSFTDFCFVLKANAYGHGIEVITKELNQYDQITIIAVATLNEALKIKEITNKEILILGYLENNLLEIAVNNDFIVTIFEIEQAQIINKIKQSKVFIKVDTGFHRLGKAPTDDYLKEVIQINRLENIIIEGIYTHLRLIDNELDNQQYYLFQGFLNKLKGSDAEIKYESILDSIALTRHSSYDQNLPRIGSLMFGLTSDNEIGKINVLPVQSLKSIVTNVVPVDSKGFGYADTKYPNIKEIAILSIGYSDGIPRDISDQGFVLIGDYKCNIVGLPSMDQLSVDITGLDILRGSIATIFGGKGITLKQLSENLDTNKNELVSGISSRVPRVYIKGNQKKYIEDEWVGEIYEY